MRTSLRTFALASVFALAACGGGTDNQMTANHISEDPFGATGAPGSDLTDNGATDGASGLADGNGAGNGTGNAAGNGH
jgi:hypothetical protein